MYTLLNMDDHTIKTMLVELICGVIEVKEDIILEGIAESRASHAKKSDYIEHDEVW